MSTLTAVSARRREHDGTFEHEQKARHPSRMAAPHEATMAKMDRANAEARAAAFKIMNESASLRPRRLRRQLRGAGNARQIGACREW